MLNKKIKTRVSKYTRMEDGIKHYYNSIPKTYELYLFKDVPTSLLTFAYSILYFPQNFFHGIESANKIGKTHSKKLLEKMIRAAHIHHMGYEKMQFQREIEYDNFNDNEKRFFDWVKTYAYIRRYTEFFKDRDKYIHPLLFFDLKTSPGPMPILHPGTARLRCTEYLWRSQKRDIMLDIMYYNIHSEELKKLEKKFHVEPIKINNFTEYLNAYGYKSYEHYKKDDKIIQYDEDNKIGYPEYIHFLKKNEYIPYLHEAHYHLFEEPDTKPYINKTIL